MVGLSQVKIGLAIAGLVLFGYGARTDDPRLRWLGIAFLAVAFLLRFVRRRRPDDTAPPPPDDDAR